MKMKMTKNNQWMWWTKGECVVKIMHTGHFPDSVIVTLPNDTQTEIEFKELLQVTFDSNNDKMRDVP